MATTSGAIRAGRAFVELFTFDSKLVQGLQLAEARVRKFAGIMARAGAAVAASAATVSAPLTAALKGALDQGDEIGQLAKNLGTTTEKLTAFGYAASTVGVPFSALVGYLDGLPEKLSALADGSGASAELLRRLGVNARQLMSLDFEDQMATLADAVKRVASPIDRARVATELFGAEGKRLLPLLEQGGAAYRKLAEEARLTGQVLPTEDARKAAAATRSLAQATEAGRNAFLRIGAALLPTAEQTKDLTTRVLAAISGVRAFVERNAALIQITGAVAIGLTVAGTAVLGFGVAIAAAITAVKAVISPIGLAVSILTSIPAPILIAVAAVAALTAAFFTLTETGRKYASDIGEYFAEMGETFSDAWGGIASALKGGDLSQAAAIAVAALDVEWKRGLLKLQEGWTEFKSFFVDGWHDAVMLFDLAFEDATGAIANALVDLLQFVSRQFSQTFDAMIAGAAKVADALGASGLAADLNGLKGIGELNAGDLKKGIQGITDDNKKGIYAGRQQQQDASDAARNEGLRSARDALTDAQNAFAQSLAVAAENERERTERETAKGGQLGGKGAEINLPALSRGTFSGANAGQFFAAPSLANRQLTEQVKANEILTDIKKNTEQNGERKAVFK